MRITLSLNTIRTLLIATLACLMLAGFVSEFGEKGLGLDGWDEVSDYLSLSHEENVPTWFSSIALFSCALVLAAIASVKQRTRAPYARHWWVMAAGFLYISMDEIVQLHEDTGGWVDTGGVLYFDWVIPASILLAILAASYLGFVTHLPRRTRIRFIVAGAFYVGGAVGMELPLGWWTDHEGRHNLTYAMIDWVEESMEMIGVSLFLYALLEYIATPLGMVWIFVPEIGREAGGASEGSGTSRLRLESDSTEGIRRASPEARSKARGLHSQSTENERSP